MAASMLLAYLGPRLQILHWRHVFSNDNRTKRGRLRNWPPERVNHTTLKGRHFVVQANWLSWGGRRGCGCGRRCSNAGSEVRIGPADWIGFRGFRCVLLVNTVWRRDCRMGLVCLVCHEQGTSAGDARPFGRRLQPNPHLGSNRLDHATALVATHFDSFQHRTLLDCDDIVVGTVPAVKFRSVQVLLKHLHRTVRHYGIPAGPNRVRYGSHTAGTRSREASNRPTSPSTALKSSTRLSMTTTSARPSRRPRRSSTNISLRSWSARPEAVPSR
jgi:hypothetical protein